MSEILSTMQQEYEDRSKNDKKLGQIRTQIKAGATYSEAEAYAARSGEILSGVLKNNIDADVFANEDLNELVVPMMRANYERVVSATSAVQSTLNQAANIGIKPIVPEFDEGAAFNLVDKMRSYDSFEEAEWLLGEPVVTNSMKCVDEMLHENADFQYRSGMSPKIVRTAESDCCDWCASLEDVYEYYELTSTDEVWKRHANCKCEITYLPGDGRAQNSWSKKWKDDDEVKRIEHRIRFSSQQQDSPHPVSRAESAQMKQDERKTAVPAYLDGDFSDYNPLQIDDQTKDDLLEMNRLANTNQYEYGQIIVDGKPGRIYTSRLYGKVEVDLGRFPNDCELKIYHSHTNNTPLSPADFSKFIDQRVVEIGNIAANKDVYITKIGYGYHPSKDEFDEAVDTIQKEVLMDMMNSPDFYDLSTEERNYVTIKEESYRIARYFKWETEGGRLDE